MTKNQIIAVVVAAVIVLGGIIYLANSGQLSQLKPPTLKEQEQQQAVSPEAEEVTESLSFVAIVKEVEPAENLLIVTEPAEEKEIKLYVSENTQIIELSFPFDLANPPADATFTPERTPRTIQEVEVDAHLMVEAETNIIGKTEIRDITMIQILP